MRRPCCHNFLASILKFLNFLQLFIGVCMIVYSAYMLNHWLHPHNHNLTPSPAPAQADSPFSDVIDANVFLSYLINGLQLNFQSLPDPWFIYAFMGVGILLCCITCIGHIAAETINGCCLCFYAVLATLFIILEATLVAFIAIDRRWEQILPPEPTGELDSLRIFVEENMDFCKWIAIAVTTLQALSLLLAIILRALVSSERVDVSREEEYYRFRTREPLLNTREPLLNTQSGQTVKGDSQVTHDIWSARMREKYGLNIDETKNH